MTDQRSPEEIAEEVWRYAAAKEFRYWDGEQPIDGYDEWADSVVKPRIAAAIREERDRSDFMLECLQGVSHSSLCERNAISNPSNGFLCLRCQLEDERQRAERFEKALREIVGLHTFADMPAYCKYCAGGVESCDPTCVRTVALAALSQPNTEAPTGAETALDAEKEDQ